MMQALLMEMPFIPTCNSDTAKTAEFPKAAGARCQNKPDLNAHESLALRSGLFWLSPVALGTGPPLLSAKTGNAIAACCVCPRPASRRPPITGIWRNEHSSNRSLGTTTTVKRE